MIIGIDPDVDKSGVYILNDGWYKLATMPLWEVFETIRLRIDTLRQTNSCYVVIEAGWKNKRGLPFSQGRMRAVRTGMNHAIGMQIEAFCKAYEIEYELFVPTCRTPKWSHETMCRLTGVDAKKSNQEMRDAVRAVYFSSKGKEIFK